MVRWIVRHPLIATAAPLALFLASAGLLLALQTSRHPTADRWLFLTGSEDEVRRFVRERLKLAAEPNASPEATEGSRVLHSPKLTLIDKRGHISGYFDGTDPVAVGRLKLAAERLAREA